MRNKDSRGQYVKATLGNKVRSKDDEMKLDEEEIEHKKYQMNKAPKRLVQSKFGYCEYPGEYIGIICVISFDY